MVSDRLETDLPGIFACGNVLHVHDLVDYVSQEAALAGESAAAFVRSGGGETGRRVRVAAGNGVRYTVPQFIGPDRMAEAAVVRFRVTDVFRDACVRLSLDGRELARRKKRVLAPGEMEQMTVTRSDLAEARADSVLTVELEA